MKWLISAIVLVAFLPIVLISGLLTVGVAVNQQPAAAAVVSPTGSAEPFTGPNGYVNDPTSRGRITRRMLHTYQQIQKAFDGWPWGVHCWDLHTWNPTSDHPKGRACDFTVDTIGRYPNRHDRATGWKLAHWLQANAAHLGISYVIWQGHIWNPRYAAAGWRPYNGAGIYSVRTPTGGHYDHLHVSTG